MEGLEGRLTDGIAQAHARGLPVQASVTVNRLVRYEELPDTLRRLGFDHVAFSYPRREPFGSTSLVYERESQLVDLNRDELLAALDSIGRLRKQFPVLSPQASLAEVARYVHGERQAVLCIGGYKDFRVDWNLNIWRCEAWNEPMGSVFNLDRIPDQREPCNACTMACYRNASMLMHAAVAATDAAQALAAGQIGTAVASLFRRSVAQSVWALIEETPKLHRLARRREQNRDQSQGFPPSPPLERKRRECDRTGRLGTPNGEEDRDSRLKTAAFGVVRIADNEELAAISDDGRVAEEQQALARLGLAFRRGCGCGYNLISGSAAGDANGAWRPE